MLGEETPELILLGLFLPDGPSYPHLDTIQGSIPIVGLANVFHGPMVRKLLMQRYGFVEILERPLAGANLVELVRLHLGLFYPRGATPQAVDDANRSEPMVEDETTSVGRVSWEMPSSSADETRIERMNPSSEQHGFVRVRTSPQLRPVGGSTLLPELDWRQAADDGNLDVVGFPTLLARILHTRHTGSLQLWRQRVRKIAYFDAGRPVSMRSNLLYECLGHVLLRQGYIDETTCTTSIERAQAEGRRQGEVLLAMGAIDRGQLAAALKAQLRERLLDVFGWSDGRYQLQTLKLTPNVAPFSREETVALILEGVLTRFSQERIIGGLSSFWSATPRLQTEAHVLEEMPLSVEHRSVIEAMRSGCSLLELIAQFDQNTRVHSIVYALLVLGYLSLE
jgi:hypothetical protein